MYWNNDENSRPECMDGRCNTILAHGFRIYYGVIISLGVLRGQWTRLGSVKKKNNCTIQTNSRCWEVSRVLKIGGGWIHASFYSKINTVGIIYWLPRVRKTCPGCPGDFFCFFFKKPTGKSRETSVIWRFSREFLDKLYRIPWCFSCNPRHGSYSLSCVFFFAVHHTSSHIIIFVLHFFLPWLGTENVWKSSGNHGEDLKKFKIVATLLIRDSDVRCEQS